MVPKNYHLLRVTASVLALPTLAQNPTVEYGNPGELRGVKKVFVDTGADIELRNRILEEIQKRLPDLDIASAPEAAEIHLRFSLKRSEITV